MTDQPINELDSPVAGCYKAYKMISLIIVLKSVRGRLSLTTLTGSTNDCKNTRAPSHELKVRVINERLP